MTVHYEPRSLLYRSALNYCDYLTNWIKSNICIPLETAINRLSTSKYRKRGRYKRANIHLKHHRWDRGRAARSLLIYLTVFQTSALAFPTVAHAASFDTDGKELYIDNCATACITNDPNACATTPILTNRRVKGISGMLDSKVYETTIKWDIEDDDGVAETEFIPKSFYIPNAPNSLLCPQHWARTRNNKPGQTKARCVTYGRSIILEWEGKRRTRSIPLNVTGSNVAMIKTAPGFSAYQSFCHECSTTPFEEDYHPVTALANVIEDDEEETPLTADQLEDEHPEIYFPARDMPLATEFNIDGPTDGQSTPAIVTDEEDGSPQDSSV